MARAHTRSWGLQQNDRRMAAMPELHTRTQPAHKSQLPRTRAQVDGTTARAFLGTAAKRQAHGCNAA
eukprot:3297594-Lingulodinium_polyedra.AAC.1